MEDELERAWSEVVAGWDQGDRHKRFLVLANASGKLAEAGRRYREVKEREPARAAEAERRIDEVLALAMAQMQVARADSDGPSTKRRVEWVAAGVSVALIAAALWQLFR